MSGISRATSSSFSSLSQSTIRFRDRSGSTVTVNPVKSVQNAGLGFTRDTSLLALTQVRRLQESLLKLQKVGSSSRSTNSSSADSIAAVATSTTSIGLQGQNYRLSSSEEINTDPTSFTQNGPAWTNANAGVAWSGLGSTAQAFITGDYDGRYGNDTLKFEVRRGGTHGENNLQIRVFDSAGTRLETIRIDAVDPINQVYQLDSGLELQLSAGSLVRNDYFEVDLSLASASYDTSTPAWQGSTSTATIGGTYLGVETGTYTIRVDRDGVLGERDLRLKVYDTTGRFVENINIAAEDPIGQEYALSNGLTIALSAGEINKNETLEIAVEAFDLTGFTTSPEWNLGTSTPTITGTYDGSFGEGTLHFEARRTGTLGSNDLRVRVRRPDGSVLRTLQIDRENPVDQVYEIGGGLSVTFSEGTMIDDETFSIELQTATDFSTEINPSLSTATPYVDGTYDGSLGSDTLEFTVSQGGDIESDDIQLEVRTTDGTLVDTISILSTDSAGQTYTTAAGLNVSFASGNLVTGETFTVDIENLVPTTVNPTLSFDGRGVDDAKVENTFTIVDGSFDLNGVSVDVYASDSISSVLDRINNLGIDVQATFDAAQDRIVLESETLEVAVSNDTSGFLDAMKLADATLQESSHDSDTILDETNLFAGFGSGTFEVNGETIYVDATVDSLEDVLARIEATVPEVEAIYDDQTDEVTLRSTGSEPLELAEGSVNFFAKLGITVGSYAPESEGSSSGGTGTRIRGAGRSNNSRQFAAKAVEDFALALNQILNETPNSADDPFLNRLRQSVANLLPADDTFNGQEFGLRLDRSATRDRDVLTFTQSRGQFAKALRSNRVAASFSETFYGSASSTTSGNTGLVESLLRETNQLDRDIRYSLAVSGQRLDIEA
ncbi:MAG: hypothetical protein ACE361_03655 [Aureliella sp.]